MNEQRDSEEALIARAKAGDRSAFENLCDRGLPHVYQRLCTLLPPEEVEDVTQEVFVAAVRGLSGYRCESSFTTWLAGIARHKVLDYYRKRGRRPKAILLDDDCEVTEPGDWEETALVRSVLGRLSEGYQEILLLRFVEDLPFELIAQRLNVSLEAAKSRFRRAVQAMARELAEERVVVRGTESSL